MNVYLIEFTFYNYSERLFDRSIERSFERLFDRSVECSSERSFDRSIERSFERLFVSGPDHTCSIIILIWLHSLSGVIRSLLCKPQAFSPGIKIIMYM